MALHQSTRHDSPAEGVLPACVAVTVLSHHGAVRSTNEDCVLIGELVLSERTDPEPVSRVLELSTPALVAVADGLGGHGGGEIAAQTAIRRIAQEAPDLNSAEAIAESVHRASEDVRRRAAATAGAHDMGTTLVAIVVTSGGAFCFNVGDSPAFRLEAGYLQQIATLDSPAQAGEGGSAAVSALVTQVLGPGTSRLVPHVREISVQPNDTYLLCSDGLTDMVPLTDIERLLQENAEDDSRAVKSLWAAAMNAGGRDNITIAVIRRDQRRDARAPGRPPTSPTETPEHAPIA